MKNTVFFENVIQILIFCSILSFSISTLPNLSANTYLYLRYIDISTLIIFSIEYCIRLWMSKQKLRYIFSFLGLIDLIAILPFYLTLGFDLRSLRIFRFFRLISLFKVARYSKAAQRLSNTIKHIKEELILYLILTFFLTYLSACGIYLFENPVQPEKFKSVFHSMWWAISTLTTVGYGDIYPITTGGKIFTFFILLLGLGLVAVPSGLLASAFSETQKN